jgi:hypothetical protein
MLCQSQLLGAAAAIHVVDMSKCNSQKGSLSTNVAF